MTSLPGVNGMPMIYSTENESIQFMLFFMVFYLLIWAAWEGKKGGANLAFFVVVTDMAGIRGVCVCRIQLSL